MKNAFALILAVFLLVAARPAALSTSSTPPPTPESVRADFLRLIERPRVAPDVRHREIKAPFRNVVAEKLDFASERLRNGNMERVPVLAVKPEGAAGRLPAVIVLHGTGGRKEQMWPWLEQLAHRGFLAVAIDGRFHGERDGGKPGTTAYNEAIYRAFQARPDEQMHPFYFDTCWDVMRTVDYLATRDDVDAGRVGVIGTSKGGIEAYLTAAVDPRIQVVVPAIAMQSFAWGLNHERWQARANTAKLAHEMVAKDLQQPELNSEVCRILWAKIIPGIRDEFDGPSMVRLLAGRPTLILNGENDPNCPIKGAELAFDAARAAFHEADADDRLKILVAPGVGHAVTGEQHQAALDWCVQWLKPTVPASTARYLFRRARPASPEAVGRAFANFVGPPRPRPVHPSPGRRPFGRRGDPSALAAR